jgi:hypothetical protein
MKNERGANLDAPGRLLRRAVAWVGVALSLSGCWRTVEWQEEVALSPADRVWVKRQVRYEPSGGAGNPLDIGWRGRHYELEFEWRGNSYRFEQHGAPTVLRLGSSGQPLIIAPADAGAWDAKHRYACTTPFYVQFEPDATRRNWTWPAHIDPAYHGTETNLLQVLPRPGTGKPRYSAQEVKAANATLDRSPQRQRVEPAYTADHCRQRRAPRQK